LLASWSPWKFGPAVAVPKIDGSLILPSAKAG
jgi:hypothetical protein